MASAYKAAENLNKEYLAILKNLAKAKRQASGGLRIPLEERRSLKHSARTSAQEAIKSRGGAVVNDETKGSPRHGYVVAIDKFMSGWGGARGGKSYYVIAVDTPEEARIVMDNMSHRSDMKHVRHQGMLPEVKRGDHMHIVDKRKADRFFKPSHEGGFGQPKRKAIPINPARRVNPTRLEALQNAAADVGLYVTTYSPGDGVTRYRFHEKPASYFSDSGIHTALGLKKAWEFLQK